jgi:hypothetical protein
VRAVDLAIGAPSWFGPTPRPRSALSLDYLTGDWRFLRRGDVLQFQVDQLVLSREQKDSPLPAFTVEMSEGHLHGSLESAPLRSLAAIAHWLAPQLAPDAVALEGQVEDIDVDWNRARPEGARLAASAKVDETLATSVTHGFALKGLPARLHASESRLGVESRRAGRAVAAAADPEWPVDAMKLVSRVAITRSGNGWQVAIAQLTFRTHRSRVKSTAPCPPTSRKPCRCSTCVARSRTPML